MTSSKPPKGSLNGIPVLIAIDQKSPKPLYQQTLTGRGPVVDGAHSEPTVSMPNRAPK